MANVETFWQKLNNGPAILFLGQSYLGFETGKDPLIAEILGRFSGLETTRTLDMLWEATKDDDGEAVLAWISERCRRLAPPEWLTRVADFAWNGVLSSAIDPIWISAFRNDWRELAPIYDEDYFPRNPRSRRQLNCTFMFGSLNQTESKQRPPLSQLEYLRRQQTARNLAQRLPDVLTSAGRVGYRSI